MKEAFTYMFKDPMFNKKAIVYFGICFLSLALTAATELAATCSGMCLYKQNPQVTPVTTPLFTLLHFIGLGINFVLCGYYFTCVQAISKQQNNIVLPFMNIKTSFVKGLKFFVAVFLTTLAAGIFYALCCIISKQPLRVWPYSLILGLIFLICGNAFTWLFSIEGKISTFFAWKKTITLIKQNAIRYFKNWGVTVLLIIVSAMISTLFMNLFNYLFNNVYIAWIVTSIEGAIIASFTAFAGMYLVAKSIHSDSVV